jgi:hypothetical protein
LPQLKEGEARETWDWPVAGAGRKGAAPEVEEGADRWAPPVGDRVKEREGSGALGRVGRKRAAREKLGRSNWVAAGKKRKGKKKRRRWAGPRVEVR